MSALILRAALGTMLAAVIGGIVLMCRAERRRERAMHEACERHLEDVHRRLAGLPPPGHPDWETALSDAELGVLAAIEAGLAGREDAGLGILGDDTGGAR